MSNRLSKIVTRGGDKGETSLADGSRISKDELLINLIGDIDELNSWIGVALAHLSVGEVSASLKYVQHGLFDLGGALSIPGAPLLSEAHVVSVDHACEALNRDLPPLREFILPGGPGAMAWLHIARTVCRRAERKMAAFYRDNKAAANALQYLNRLSDYLFIAARYEAKRLGVDEIYWKKGTAGENR